MKVLKESGHRYALNSSGILVDSDDIPLELKEHRGEWYVSLDWIPNRNDFLASRIVLMIDRELKLDILDVDKIKVFHRDGDSRNIHPSNLDFQYWPSLECCLKKDYYHIPGFHDLVISRSGDLYSLHPGKHKTWYTTTPGKKSITGGYRATSFKTDAGLKKMVSRHRALALCFIEAFSPPVDRIINHIDGVPGNDSIENLEWVTYSENTLHAYANGLHPNKITKCQSYNWKTGEILTFDMVADCIRHHKVKEQFLWSRLTRGNSKKFSDGMVYRFYSDGPWILDDFETPAKPRKKVLAKNVFTNEVLLFDSIRETSEFTEVPDGTIEFYLVEKSILIKNSYVFRYIEDLPWPKHDKYQLELARRNPLGRSIAGILVRDCSGETLYTSHRECVEALGTTKNKLNILLKKQPDKYIQIFPNKLNTL